MIPGISIRDERDGDAAAIAVLTELAFRGAAHSSQTEHFIVGALRRAGQLSVSLVAEEGGGGALAGHIALSPVQISGSDDAPGAGKWYGLGPVSVLPRCQGRGIGGALLTEALARLRGLGGSGCVVLGSPGYYGRFGFRAHSGLILPGVPPEYFQALSFGDPVPQGEVRYHPAFDAAE